MKAQKKVEVLFQLLLLLAVGCNCAKFPTRSISHRQQQQQLGSVPHSCCCCCNSNRCCCRCCCGCYYYFLQLFSFVLLGRASAFVVVVFCFVLHFVYEQQLFSHLFSFVLFFLLFLFYTFWHWPFAASAANEATLMKPKRRRGRGAVLVQWRRVA